jgi:hypothetical protein
MAFFVLSFSGFTVASAILPGLHLLAAAITWW